MENMLFSCSHNGEKIGFPLRWQFKVSPVSTCCSRTRVHIVVRHSVHRLFTQSMHVFFFFYIYTRLWMSYLCFTFEAVVLRINAATLVSLKGFGHSAIKRNKKLNYFIKNENVTLNFSLHLLFPKFNPSKN